jgi:sugar phosphate isomerase/epimerase
MTPSSLGISATSYLSVWETMDTLEFLERCHGFGAAGLQAVLRGDLAKIRATAERYGMYLEAMVPLPVGEDTTEFEAALKNARTVGATALRAACLGTRRYETFKTLDAWRAHVSESRRSLAAALPLLDKYKIPLGLENHKDWTADELLALLKQFPSEYLGVCLDFGNNISLLDSPMETIEKLAPYAVSTHLKDMAVAPYAEGILLSEVILGTGHIDLLRAVRLIRKAKPGTRMTLEMITRDPLKIPLLTDSYWTTLPDKSALELARTLRFVNEHNAEGKLPAIGRLSRAELRGQEDQNVMDCLAAWRAISA